MCRHSVATYAMRLYKQLVDDSVQGGGIVSHCNRAERMLWMGVLSIFVA